MSKRDLIAEMDPDVVFADGFDDAIIGLGERCGEENVVVYDAQKCIDILGGGDEAREHFEFNVAGAWIGERTPIYVWRIDLDD